MDGGIAPMIFFIGDAATLKNLNTVGAVLREKNALFPADKKVGVDFPNFYGKEVLQKRKALLSAVKAAAVAL